MKIQSFTFNEFQENTYILYDGTGECMIIDPGCNNPTEEKQLTDFIESHSLTPISLINTHCHLDHVLGNRFIFDTYGLTLQAHQGEQGQLNLCMVVAEMYGIRYNPSPEINTFIGEDDVIECGHFKLKAIFTPGHSPASLSFYEQESQQLISGDVLFRDSIGRSDLPGGDHKTLIGSIKEKLFPLGESVKVYPGHGPPTSIGYEMKYNPFLS